MKVVSPCFEGADYAHEFSVIYFIVSLCRVEGVRYISTGVVVSVHVLLSYNCPGGELGGIRFDDKWFHQIGHQKYWCFLEFFFQFLKHFLTSVCPIPNQVFLCQVVQGSRNICIVSNEFPIKVSES